MRAHNVLRNSYNTRPLLCARITCCVTVILQEGVGESFQQYFYNRYNIVVYTGLR
jgi:hypothetical protein